MDQKPNFKKLPKSIRRQQKARARIQAQDSKTCSSNKITTHCSPHTMPESSKILEVEQKKPKSKVKGSYIRNSRVIYINDNYGGNDANSIGSRVQTELIELRKQSDSIKSASDLTVSQAHVVKRQITRLQGATKKKRGKRQLSIGDAANELKLIMQKQARKNNKK